MILPLLADSVGDGETDDVGDALASAEALDARLPLGRGRGVRVGIGVAQAASPTAEAAAPSWSSRRRVIGG
jgi:hypothetical protein